MPKGLPISYIRKWGISKLAWRKFRAGALTRGVPTRTAAIRQRIRGNPKMARRRYRRYFPRRRRKGRGGMTIPIAPIIGFGAGLVNPGTPVLDPLIKGDFNTALRHMSCNYLGYDPAVGQWKWDYALRGIGPIVVGLLIHKFVGGKPLNFNAMLARAKVPFIRI